MVTALKVPTVLIDGFTVNVLAFVTCVLVLVLAWLAVRGPGLWSKVLALTAALGIFGVVALAHVEQLSWPKPITLAWVQSQGRDGLVVKDVVAQPPKQVYLWLMIGNQPRYFTLPWSQSIQDALDKMQKRWKNGEKGELRFRYQPSLEDEGRYFRFRPWPKPPSKERLRPPPEEHGA